MNSSKSIMKPASLRTIDKVGKDIEGLRVFELRVNNVRYSIVVEEDL